MSSIWRATERNTSHRAKGLVALTWKKIESIADWSNIQSKIEAGDSFAIFKHSTRCSISSAAYSRLERKWEANFPNLSVYYLDLIANRSISNQIATDLQVQHESPQLILFKNKGVKAVYNHFEIDPSRIAI